jgi:GH24 family phage-related lysozyme (muramidase)
LEENAMQLPDKNLPWPISYESVCEIARSEGCRLKAYRCSAGVPTIGWGETRNVKMGDSITQQQADSLFLASLREFTDGVKASLTRDASANELGAMVSLAYNIGLGGFRKSTVLRQHNAGNFQAAARAFSLWNKAGGKILPGLTARRAREASLYLTPDDGQEALPMAQDVESESTLTHSPIAQSGVISIVGGAGAAIASVVDPVRDMADKLAIDPLLVLGVLGIVVGLVVYEQRKKQRSEGWA